MSGLFALQSAMQAHLLHGDMAITLAIAGGPGITTAQRLRIYHHAYRMRLVDTLRDSFGHTLRYLGDEWFNEAALAHVEAHPSNHPNLRWYGADFADSLRQRHPDDPDIAELATLDWALRSAFDGADAPVLALADLGAVAPEAWAQLVLVLHPTTARLRLQHNTLTIWHTIDQDQVPPAAQALAEPTELLVWRRELSPHFRSLGAFEARALDLVLAGVGFSAVCEQLAAAFPGVDLAVEAGALLRRWVDDGLLSALHDQS